MHFWVYLVLLGLIGGNSVLAWLHFAEPDHSPRHDLISLYAHSKFPKVYAWHNITFVIAGIGAAIGSHQYSPHEVWLPLLCLAYSAGIAILALFPMDISAKVKTLTGVLHVVGVVEVFFAATVYSFSLSSFGSLAKTSHTKVLFDVVLAYLVGGISLLLIGQVRKFSSLGLIERIAAAGLSLWLISILLTFH